MLDRKEGGWCIEKRKIKNYETIRLDLEFY